MHALLVLAVDISLLWHCLALPVWKEDLPKTNQGSERVKKTSDEHDYVHVLYDAWKEFKAVNCSATFNGQQISKHMCKGNAIKTFQALDSAPDDYSDCELYFSIELEETHLISGAELAIYKLPEKQNQPPYRYYTVFLKHKDEVIMKSIKPLTEGWIMFSLDAIASEWRAGQTGFTIAVYVSQGNFLSCSAVKSQFIVGSTGTLGLWEHCAPALKVFVNGTDDITDTTMATGESSGHDSECSGEASGNVCASDRVLCFKPQKKGKTSGLSDENSCELYFNVSFRKETPFGADLVLYLQTNSTDYTYTVYIFEKESPILYLLVTNKEIPVNSSGWQLFNLDSIAANWDTDMTYNLTLNIRMGRTTEESEYEPLSCSEIQSLFILEYCTLQNLYDGSGSAADIDQMNYLPIITTFTTDGCGISCGKSLSKRSMVTTEGSGQDIALITPDKPDASANCHLQDYEIELNEIQPNILLPYTVNIHQCSAQCDSHDRSTFHGLLKQIWAIFNTKHHSACCVPTRYDPLYILQLNEDGVTELRLLPDVIITQCNYR